MTTKTKYTRKQFMKDLMTLNPCGDEIHLEQVPGNLNTLVVAVKAACDVDKNFCSGARLRAAERSAIRCATGDFLHPGLGNYPVPTRNGEEANARRLVTSLHWLQHETASWVERAGHADADDEGGRNTLKAAKRIQKALKHYGL